MGEVKTKDALADRTLEVIARAIGAAEVEYNIRLVRMIDEVCTYTVDYGNGEPVLEFGSHNEASAHVAERRNIERAKAAYAAMLAASPPPPIASSTGEERRVYLDLDGVMADFDAHFPAVFGFDHRMNRLGDDELWAKINSHPSYFRDMPLCPGALDFYKSIEHLSPIILTACPKSNYAHAAQQKRAWVRAHLPGSATVLPVMGGINKPLFMHAQGDILIDDYKRNIAAWNEAGGTGILHTSFGATIFSLIAQGFTLTRIQPHGEKA